MDFLKYAKENEKNYFDDLNTLVRVQSATGRVRRWTRF